MLGLGFTKYNRTPTPHPTIRYALNKVKVYYSFIKISEIKWLSFCSAIFSMWPPSSRSSYDSEWLLQLQPSHLPSRKTAEKTEGPKGPHTFPFIEPLWQEPHPSSFYVSLVKSWSYGHIQLQGMLRNVVFGHWLVFNSFCTIRDVVWLGHPKRTGVLIPPQNSAWTKDRLVFLPSFTDLSLHYRFGDGSGLLFLVQLAQQSQRSSLLVFSGVCLHAPPLKQPWSL